MTVLVAALLRCTPSQHKVVAHTIRSTNLRSQFGKVIDGEVEVGEHGAEPNALDFRNIRFHGGLDDRVDI